MGLLNAFQKLAIFCSQVSLGRNPITAAGWLNFKNCFVDAASVHEVCLTHLSVSALGDTSKMQLHSAGAVQLASILPKLEEVDLTGQYEVGVDGWAGVCNELRKAVESSTVRLRLLRVGRCRIKEETRAVLDETVAKSASQHGGFKVDYGKEEDEKNGRRGKKCLCC